MCLGCVCDADCSLSHVGLGPENATASVKLGWKDMCVKVGADSVDVLRRGRNGSRLSRVPLVNDSHLGEHYNELYIHVAVSTCIMFSY